MVTVDSFVFLSTTTPVKVSAVIDFSGDDSRRDRKTAPLYERSHYVQANALPWYHQRKRTAFMQERDAKKVQTAP